MSEQLLLMSSGQTPTKPYRMRYNEQLEAQISGLESQLRDVVGDEYPARWLAIRFLDGDRKLIATLKERLKAADKGGFHLEQLKRLEALTAAIPSDQVEDVRENIVGELFKKSRELCSDAVTVTNRELLYRSERLDRIFTSKLWGFPIMLAMLGVIFT